MLAARLRRPLVACAGLFVLGACAPACSSSKPVPLPARSQELWGDLKPVVSVKELMQNMIDPVADDVFGAAGTVVTTKGTVELAPKTDEDWDKVRTGAVSLAEGIYLLKIPRPFTPPGDENNSTGPDAPELSPAQIKAKLEADPVLWNAKIEALRNVALEVLDIAKRKNADELLAAGADLEGACESCHLEYWYPNEKGLLQRLGQKPDALFKPPAR